MKFFIIFPTLLLSIMATPATAQASVEPGARLSSPNFNQEKLPELAGKLAAVIREEGFHCGSISELVELEIPDERSVEKNDLSVLDENSALAARDFLIFDYRIACNNFKHRYRVKWHGDSVMRAEREAILSENDNLIQAINTVSEYVRIHDYNCFNVAPSSDDSADWAGEIEAKDFDDIISLRDMSDIVHLHIALWSLCHDIGESKQRDWIWPLAEVETLFLHMATGADKED